MCEPEFFIGVDWSGANAHAMSTPGLAVAIATTSEVRLISWHKRKRSRAELIEWLALRLRPDQPSTCIGLDFAFGFPKGALSAVFGLKEWRELPEKLSWLMGKHATANAVASAINEEPRFKGSGPFRTNDTRTQFRFYIDHGVQYFRVVENFVPQAISQWYMGSGATVAFSTLTGLAALGELLQRRNRGEIDFSVFPFEEVRAEAHVLMEIYPAIWPKLHSPNVSEHQADALRAATGLRRINGVGRIPTLPHIDEASLKSLVSEEGWIAGVE